MRVATIVLALVLAAVAHAQDDDAVLETPPLGEPLPERMQTLEKEWDDDVGTKDHAVEPAEPADEADPFERNAAPDDGQPVEVKAPPAPAEPDAPPKRVTTLEEPLAEDKPTLTPPSKTPDDQPKKPTPSERRAAALKEAE